MANVAAPPLRPPRYSLVIAARDGRATDDADFRFDQFGIKWTPAACDNEVGPGPKICDLTAQEEAYGSSISPDVSDDCEDQTFEPIPLWAGYRVSAFGDAAANEQRVRDRLAATESYQLAKELWAGAVAIASTPDLANNYFAKTGSAEVITGPVGIEEAVAVLDAEIGDCLKGARGMLHVTPKVLAQLAASGVVRMDGALWVTPIGNVVVADAGYPGTAPSGQSTTAQNQWAFATGTVDVRLSPVFLRGSTEDGTFHRRTNTFELRAERLGAAVFDPCCLLAVQIDPCSSPCAA